MCRLVPFRPKHVRGLAERTVSFLGKEPWHIFPLDLLRRVILDNHAPQIAHLFLPCLGLIELTPEIAMITRLLCKRCAMTLLIRGSIISREQTKAVVG